MVKPTKNQSNENELLHTTSTMMNLKSILKSKSLKLSYSKEKFRIGNQVISSAAHPMVCFSEYNYKDLIIGKEITNTYGRYGIVFKRKWVDNKKIGPVLYIKGNSLAAKGLKTLLRERRENTNLPDKVKLAIMEIKCFTKNEKGRNDWNKKKVLDFDFKSENEWRYVPTKRIINNNLISIPYSTYTKTKANEKKYNKRLEAYPLKFKVTDIKCIFVSSESEKTYISQKYPNSSIEIKISKWKK